MSERIAFIGAGNMARSLVGGLLASGSEPATLIAADPDAAQRDAMRTLGVESTDSNAAAVVNATTIVLAVKPQVMRDVVRGLAAALRPAQLLISIAAGVSCSAISRWCGQPLGIVRCMPNTPALYGAGMTVLYANNSVTPQQHTTAESVLAAVGRVLWSADETALDAVTALSGSGPAYFFYLMEAMIEAGTTLGLDDATARALTLQTATGAALMADRSGIAPAQLRRSVTSPGGTTQSAITTLDSAGVRDAIVAAVRAAAARSAELAREFGAN
jgi:pyrroline-5-carboxylate reductase